MTKLGKELRSDFPIFSRQINGHPLVYLDNAATSQKPQPVLDAIMDFYTQHNANIFRGIYTIAEEATALYESAREKVAHFIGSDANELIFTSGTTEGINFVAASWAREHLKSADQIIVSGLEHHSNLLPWQRCAQQTGARLVFAPINPDGTVSMEQFAQLINKKVKLVAISHVGNVLGTHQDIAKIIQMAHAVGAKVLVDAAQSVPHQLIDVHALDCDFVAFSAHKMCGPTGIGALYIRKELHETMAPYQVGGGMVNWGAGAEFSWHLSPHKFEAGTPPIAQAIGFGAACDYLKQNVDFQQLQTFEASLCAQLIEGLSALKKVNLYGPLDQLKIMGHQISFNITGVHPHDVAAFCDNFGICVRAGTHCAQPLSQVLGIGPTVRASFYVYNSPDEVELLIETIAQL